MKTKKNYKLTLFALLMVLCFLSVGAAASEISAVSPTAEDRECPACGSAKISKIGDHFSCGGSWEYECNECGNTWTKNATILHNYEYETLKYPTCTQPGQEEYFCYDCAGVLPDANGTREIPPTGHNYQESSRVNASCTEKGQVVYICWNKNQNILETDEFCNSTYTEELPALGHQWDNGVVTKEPTCTQNGTMLYTCTRNISDAAYLPCGQTRTEAIPATGHSWSGWTVTKAATCTAAGTEERHCTTQGCTASETRSIPATGHSWSGWTTTKAATCTAAGTEERHCTNTGCSASENNTIPATGHNYPDNWTVKESATEEKEGQETKTCTLCGNILTQTIPKLTPAPGPGGEEPTEPPADNPPTEDPADNPPTEDPAEDPADNPPTEDPAEDPTDEPPAEDPTEDPTDEPPAEDPTEDPTDEPPAEDPTEEPGTDNPDPGNPAKPRKRILWPAILGLIAAAGALGFTAFKVIGASRAAKAAAAAAAAGAAAGGIIPDFSRKYIYNLLNGSGFSEKVTAELKDKRYIKYAEGDRENTDDLPKEIRNEKPDLVIMDLDEAHSLEDNLHLIEDINKICKIVSYAFVVDDCRKDCLPRLEELKTEGTIRSYVTSDVKPVDGFVKLILPMYKPVISAEGTLENIGKISDKLGIPFVSAAVSVHSTILDLRDDTAANGFSLDTARTIVASIADVMGWDKITEVSDFIDDVQDKKELVEEEKLRRETKDDPEEA